MKIKKIIIFGSLALLALIITGFILVGIYTDRIVDPFVRSLLEVNKPMGHHIEYKKIRVNLFQGSIIIKDVRMFPDTVLTKHRPQMEIGVKDIRLTGFSVREILFDRKLTVRDFIVEDPDVKMTLPPKSDSVVKEVRKKKPPKSDSPLLTHISLEKITFSGGTFQLVRNDTLLAESQDIRLIAQSIDLVRNSKSEPIGYTYGDITLELSQTEIFAQKGLYDMSLAGLSITKRDSSATLRGFRMIPKYDKKEFSKKLEFQNDRFDLDIAQVRIGGIGIERFLAGGLLEISSIQIDSIQADIFRDKNVKFNNNRFPKFYNESFLSVPVPVIIDTVAITNSNLVYGELVAGHPVAGTISLENFGLQSYGLTNQPDNDTVENFMHFHIQAMVLGKGPMKVELKLPLEGDLHRFECSGSVGAMPLKPLNDMLEPSISMRFHGGTVTRMTFAFKANENTSKGWMEFLYKDLNVVFLNKESAKENGFISALANWVAVSNNPKAPGKEVKIVEIGYERNKNKGLINYVWKTIQSGMVRTIIPVNKYKIRQKQNK
jgi:hypothetical protein